MDSDGFYMRRKMGAERLNMGRGKMDFSVFLTFSIFRLFFFLKKIVFYNLVFLNIYHYTWKVVQVAL